MKRMFDIKPVQTRRESKDGDLIVSMAFSSEEPVERWWGTEVLDHSETSIRLDRLNDGAPVLFNHDPYDLRGTHESGTVKVGKDRVLRGEIRLESATEKGRDTIGLVERKVLKKASVGYRVHKVIEQTTKRGGEKVSRELDGATFERMLDDMEETHGRKVDRVLFRSALDQQFGKLDRAEDDDPVFRVMDWEPIENSLVTIPADNSVGISRSGAAQRPAAPAVGTPAVSAIHRRESAMEKAEEQRLAAEAEAAAQRKREQEAREKADREAEEDRKRTSAQDMEKSRRRAIENLCKANNLDDRFRDMWIGQGISIETVSDDILRILEERGKTNPQAASRLGLTQTEVKRYSLSRAIVACVDQDWGKAGFELECSREVAKRLNRAMDPKHFLVPFEAMERPVDFSQMDVKRAIESAYGKRDLTVATAGAGGFLVATDNVGFIDILRNRSVAFRMGVRRLSGLVGSVTVPRQSAAATAFWLANEATGITESQQTFVQMALSPKNVGAYTEISRQLLLQSSPGAEGIVTDDLAQIVALAADLAVLEGSGAAGQPTGIANTAGIGAVTGTSIDYAKVLEFQTDVAAANVTPARGGYVTTPAIAALLLQRARFANTDTPLWSGNIWDGSVSGFPGMSSNQLAAASMIFGDWAETVVGEWGVLEVSVNPFANFAAGIIGVRAMYSMDVGVRRPFAYSRATTIT